ncbi:MAG: hypothetical protein AAFY71_24470 [Bacteroidota bacterium]
MKSRFYLSLLFFIFSLQAPAQSLDIKTTSQYHSPGKLSLKYEYYFNFWEEREIYHGRYEKWAVNGSKVYSASYHHGNKDGLETYFTKNGLVSRKIRWRNNRIHGSWQSFYPNGKQKEIYLYVEGEKEGLFQVFHKTGTLKQEGNFNKGLANGLFSYYDKSGQMKKQILFKQGKRIKQ